MKKIETVDKNLPNHVKNQLWVARHYKQILIASIAMTFFSILFTFITINRQASVISEQSQVIKNMANKVIFVRADGRVVQLEKQDLSSNAILYGLRDLVYGSLTLSGFDLNQIQNIKEVGDLIKIYKVKKMVDFLSDEGKQGYISYLSLILSTYKAGKLPEIIYVLSPIQDNLNYQNGKFVYTATIPLYLKYVENQAWLEGQANINITFKGIVDMSKSSPENPLGIIINQFEVKNYVKKE